ncbi:MAG: aminomethyltransferase family protein [Actinomycetota bacterium]
MSVGTAFHPRTAPLNRAMAWGEWSGYFAAQVYAEFHDIEYNAIREQAALIDVSPLWKYRVSGPDAVALVDRVITRDASRLAVGQVAYTPWCDEEGKLIDDGTVARRGEREFFWTAADATSRWLDLNAAGLDVAVDDLTDEVAALAVQGPRSRAVLEAASGEDLSGLAPFRTRPLAIRGIAAHVSRTGYTGDLGYEVWVAAGDAVALWDAVWEAGAAHGVRPAGIHALDVSRVEAGLILAEVEYTGARHAISEEQRYSPFEVGLDRFVDLDKPSFVGRRALLEERRRGGPARRLVGLALDWADVEARYAAHGLPPGIPATVQRGAVPLARDGRRVGHATSLTWGPTIKRLVGFGSVPPDCAALGTRLQVDWSVEGERGGVGATVVPTPFLDLPRRRA